MPQFLKSKNRIYIVISVAVSILLSVLTEFFYNLDLSEMNEAILYNQPQVEYSLNNAQTDGLVIDGKHVENDFDPKIIFSDVNKYVHNIRIAVSDMTTGSMIVQVFYAEGDEGFSEEHSVVGLLYNGQDSITLKIDSCVKAFRVDIGVDSGEAYNLEKITINVGAADYISEAVAGMRYERCVIYFMCLLFISLALLLRGVFFEFVFKYRWIIGAVLMVVLTALKINGSSIGYLANYMGECDKSNLFGGFRSIRSDEFVSFTQRAFAQVRSGFPWFSDTWGYSSSDMFMVYGQPVNSWVTIFKPFSVGYIFLGVRYGLSFYWVSRQIFLVLVSFEFGRLITKDNRKLSVIYAMLVAFSPLVEWWYSSNELLEMLIAGQSAVIFIRLFIIEAKLYKKIIYVLATVFCAGVYVISLYPAWMVPFFWCFFACLVAVIIDNRKNIHFKLSDVLLWVVGLCILAAGIGYIVYVSKDTISAVLNTTYPGNRKVYGGNVMQTGELFRNWMSYVYTFVSADNPCEAVDFISFFPLGIVLSIITLFIQKKRDTLIIALNVVNVLLILYSVMQLPSFVCEVTFLTLSFANRVIAVLGFLNVILLIRNLAVIEYKKYLPYVGAVTAIISTIVCYANYTDLLNNLTFVLVMIVSVISAVAICCYGNRQYSNLTVIVALLISIVAGVFVNPINAGVDTIYDTHIVRKIAELENEEHGTWVCCDTFIIQNLPTIVGAKSINALATYPDRDMWATIGLEEYESEWNRYANYFVKIGDTTEVVGVADRVYLTLTVDNLKSLGVDYVLSEADESMYEGLTEIYSYNNLHIWKLE